MFRHFTRAGASRSSLARARRRQWRPALEQLEPRLAPSVAPVPGHADGADPKQAAGQGGGPAPAQKTVLADPQPAQAVLAVFQAVQARSEHLVVAAESAQAPPAAQDAPPAVSATGDSSQGFPVDHGYFALPADAGAVTFAEDAQSTGGPAQPISAEPPPPEGSAPAEPAPKARVPVSLSTDRAPLVAVAAPAAEESEAAAPCAAEFGAAPVLAAHVFRPAPTPARDELPLLAWVAGITWLLAVEWEQRRGRTATLALGQARP
jgi:hypothetical protein